MHASLGGPTARTEPLSFTSTGSHLLGRTGETRLVEPTALHPLPLAFRSTELQTCPSPYSGTSPKLVAPAQVSAAQLARSAEVEERTHVSVFADEAELIHRAQQGDSAAFASLLRDNDRAMRACAYQLLGNQSNMDDALQDAYFKAFQSLNGFRSESKFSSWLYRIVYRTCLDHQRYRGRRPQVPLEHDGNVLPLAEATAAQPDSSERFAQREQLQNALAQLPEDQAAVVILVDAEGLTYDEVSAALELPRGTIASRLSRGRATLRTLLTAAAADEPEDTVR